MTHLSPREIADLDEDEYLALRDAAANREKALSWANTQELLATLIDSVNALRAELAVGMPVVQVKKLRSPSQPDEYPRPDHVEASQGDADVIVMTPRDLAKKMMGKAAS